MSGSTPLSRRSFASLIAAALVVPGAAGARPHRPTHPMKHTLIKPPRLREGDLVGLIAPGGHTSDASIDKSVRNIEGKSVV